MADQYEAKNNTISKSEELVFHFTSRESAELIIAKGSNGLRASQVRTPFPLLSAERLAVGPEIARRCDRRASWGAGSACASKRHTTLGGSSGAPTRGGRR